MSIFKYMRAIPAILLALAVPAIAASDGEWDLSGVREIELDGVSGDITVLPADGGGARVELESDVQPRGSFDVIVDQRGSKLLLEEDWSGGRSSGKVQWTFYVDGGDIEIDIDTASGSLEAEDVSITLDFSSASGDIELENVELGSHSKMSTASGDYEISDMTVRGGTKFSTASGDIRLDRVEIEDDVSFSTASGDVEANESRGSMSLKSASGDVSLRNSTVDGEGRFSSASGDVFLYLDQVPNDGIRASSASGDVIFDAGSLGGNYTLIMTADMKKGRIECPFDITSERTFERNDRTHLEQRVEHGSGGPEIELSTSSGKVVVKD